MENCVLNSDKDSLEKILSDKVIECWDAFDCAGLEGCDKKMFIDIFFKNSDSKHWNMLKQILRCGFKKVEDSTGYYFVGPSYTEREHSIIVLAENLKVRNEPSLQAKVLRTVSQGYYPCATDESGFANIYNDSWLKLLFDNGETGYILKELTNKAIDRRLKVAMVNGVWRITEYYCMMEGL